MPQDHLDPSTPPPGRQPQQPRSIRETLLFRFSGPEDAAALPRVGTILEELRDSSEQCGLGADDNQVRRAVLAADTRLHPLLQLVAQDEVDQAPEEIA